jgi:hypothetical protein
MADVTFLGNRGNTIGLSALLGRSCALQGDVLEIYSVIPSALQGTFLKFIVLFPVFFAKPSLSEAPAPLFLQREKRRQE